MFVRTVQQNSPYHILSAYVNLGTYRSKLPGFAIHVNFLKGLPWEVNTALLKIKISNGVPTILPGNLADQLVNAYSKSWQDISISAIPSNRNKRFLNSAFPCLSVVHFN